ncbi:MAG TPA: hypothetical protein VHA52_13490 [Candidatus Babeliaceae bacterium]|nr:hypothetical protein [Candidatus Babeliaceae bacterium]
MKKIRWDLIGIAGGASGVIFGAASVIRAGGSDKFLIAAAMVVVFGGMGFILYKMLWAPRFNLQRLQKTGITGKAKIIEVHETNIAVNNKPKLKLHLQVRGTDGRNFATNCNVIVSKLRPVNYFQPGREINIKIDPKNEKNVIVD